MRKVSKVSTLRTMTLALMVAGSLGCANAIAQPDWAGGGKGSGKENKGNHADKGGNKGKSGPPVDRGAAQRGDAGTPSTRGQAPDRRFDDDRRASVRSYYGEQIKAGRCPPGLAKRNNGCMPPGQARKWEVGRPLPRDVVFHELPQTLVVRMGLPPAGYRFVRVASDILMIAIGTAMVIDAIEDLGGLL